MSCIALLLCGCMSEWDMHGHDPVKYYAEHPVKNQVEMRHAVHTLAFSGAKNKVPAAAAGNLREALRDVSVAAVESVSIRLHRSQMKNSERRAALSKLITGMGYPRSAIIFEPSEEVKASEAQVDVAYAAVVSPRCPDWRMSGGTTYSNTTHSNFGCATATNLGLQVADPRDLVKGRGDVTPDAERSSRFIRQYRAGEKIGPAETSASDSAAEAPGLSTPAASQ